MAEKKKMGKGTYAGVSSDDPVEGPDFDRYENSDHEDLDLEGSDFELEDSAFEALEDDAFLKEEQSKFDEEGGAQAHEFRNDRKSAV